MVDNTNIASNRPGLRTEVRGAGSRHVTDSSYGQMFCQHSVARLQDE